MIAAQASLVNVKVVGNRKMLKLEPAVGTKRIRGSGSVGGKDDIWIYSAALATVVTVTVRMAEMHHHRKAARLWGLQLQGEWREGKSL